MELFDAVGGYTFLWDDVQYFMGSLGPSPEDVKMISDRSKHFTGL